MSQDGYYQCEMQRGNHRHVAFLPAAFAKVGATLKLLKEDNTWQDGWQVLSVGAYAPKPPDTRKAVRRHRASTGDSLPAQPDKGSH